jgi:hypothetical protein
MQGQPLARKARRASHAMMIVALAAALVGVGAPSSASTHGVKLKTFIATYGDSRFAVNVQATAGGGGYAVRSVSV